MGITIRPIYLFSQTPYEGVTHIPIITTEFLSPSLTFDQYDALILTSKTAITALNRLTCGWNRLPVVAVGEATAKEAQSYGAEVLYVASGYGQDLVEIIAQKYAQLRWFYPRPEQVANDLVMPLQQHGISISEVVLYRTLCNDAVPSISLENDAVLIFTSPSAVRCFEVRYTFLPKQKVVAIGTTTQKVLPPTIKAELPKTPTVAEAVALATLLANQR